MQGNIGDVGRIGRPAHRGLTPLIVMLAAGALALSAAGLRAAPRSQSPAPQQGSIVGSWVVRVMSDRPTETQVVSLTGDGIVIASNTPTEVVQPGEGPPGVSRTYSTTGLGAWKQSGDHQFLVTFVEVDFGDTGNLVDTVKIIASLTLNPAGDGFDGQFRVDVTDPSGNVVFASPGPIGQVTGTRITAEPFP
jgi:hypothetical protein